MKNYILKFELLTIIRDWWVAALALLIPGLIFFAIYNGNEHSESIRQELHTVLEEQVETETLLAAQMDSVSRGLQDDPEGSFPLHQLAKAIYMLILYKPDFQMPRLHLVFPSCRIPFNSCSASSIWPLSASTCFLCLYWPSVIT